MSICIARLRKTIDTSNALSGTAIYLWRVTKIATLAFVRNFILFARVNRDRNWVKNWPSRRHHVRSSCGPITSLPAFHCIAAHPQRTVTLWTISNCLKISRNRGNREPVANIYTSVFTIIHVISGKCQRGFSCICWSRIVIRYAGLSCAETSRWFSVKKCSWRLAGALEGAFLNFLDVFKCTVWTCKNPAIMPFDFPF